MRAFLSPFLSHRSQILGVALCVLLALTGLAAAENAEAQDVEDKTEHSEKAAGHHKEKHDLPLYATKIFQIGPLAVTNSMVMTWVVAGAIILFAQIATRKIKEVPEGAQNFAEWLVEGLYKFIEGVIGHELVRKTFWFFATVFIFILFSNWFGLIPGVGTVGWGPRAGPLAISHVAEPLLRGVNADLNMTFAMAMIFFGCWIVWALQANGIGGFILHIFGPKGDTKGLMKVMMVAVFMVVGVLEVVSILFRPVSLSFRLFGNIYAGENMLEAMATLIQNPPWLKMIMSPLIPIPFYFMELLVGIVQALVFMLLTAVFTLLICQHDESKGHHGHH